MQQDIKNIRKQLMQMPVIYHLITVMLVLSLLLFSVLKGLNVYTRHNKAVVIPDVRGLQLKEAAIFLENNGLLFSVVDSVFSKEVPPGAIVDVYPVVGSKVKERRIVSVTLNAKDVEKAAIPDVSDLSFRQAHAIMQAQGFSSVEIRYVQGKYRDLAVEVELNGKRLNAGEVVPLSSTLVLKVSDGGENPESDTSDSIPAETIRQPED